MRRNILRSTVIVAVLFGSMLWSLPADACSCRGGSKEKAIVASDVVFLGRVLEVTAAGGYRHATLEVIRSIKGGVSGTVEVVTRRGTGSCGYGFRHDSVLTVAARESEGHYLVNLCTMRWVNQPSP